MKKRLIILLACCLYVVLPLCAQNIPAGILAAFRKGDPGGLEPYMDEKVEIIYQGTSHQASRHASKERLATFFASNRVKGFEVRHQCDRDRSGFLIGTLKTANGNYRINCFFKKENNRYSIHQIRINKNDDD